MADYTDRFSNNAPGAFYVDEQCIDCDLCRERSPEIFRRDDEEAHSFVFRQPLNEEERLVCEEALDSCPVEAIGNDGHDIASPSADPIGEGEKNRCSTAGFVRQ